MPILPLDLEHEESLKEFLDDFAQAGEACIPAFFAKPDWSHAKTVKTFNAWSLGEDTGGWVQSTTLFLVENGRVLGVSNFRHQLTQGLKRHGGHLGYSVRPSERRKGNATKLIASAKDFARSLGLQRMLITCKPENIGSVRAIENNGGQLEEEFYHEQESCRVRLYWISL